MSLDRRRFLEHSSTLATGILLALAGPSRVRGKDAPGEQRATPYKDAIVIDGNLVPPFDDNGAVLDKATAFAVKSSGLTAIKASIGGSSGNFEQTSEQIDAIDKCIAADPGVYTKITQVTDIAAAKRNGQVGIIYSFEGVEMLEGKLERIDHFRARGVRVMQLSYNRPSLFASGVLSTQPSAGLTTLGHEAVQRMNALGVTLDLSHCDEISTLAAVSVAAKPVLITHAGCTAVYAHPRNKSDRVLRAVADQGGVVGIYDLSFLVRAPKQPTLDDYLAHMLHALKICGEDHVGIGSDALLMPFDTSPASMAEWNKDIAARKASGVGAPGEGPPPFVVGLNRPDRCRLIAEALAHCGCKGRVIDKILGLNFQRSFAETWT